MSDIIIEPIELYGISSQNRPKQLFSKVGIVGCGTVGQSIALLISQKELEVVFIEISEEKIKEAYAKIEAELDALIEHWSMTPGEKRAILSRISGGLSFDRLDDCDMVIESISS
jgi:3-hydroxybutyryl-CoA dehydrogenase